MLSAIDGELIFGLDWRDHGFFEIWYFLYYSKTRPLLHDVALRWRIIDLEEISPSSFRGTVKRVDLAPPDVSTPRHVDADGTCTVTLSADKNDITAADCGISYAGAAGPMVLKLDFTGRHH